MFTIVTGKSDYINFSNVQEQLTPLSVVQPDLQADIAEPRSGLNEIACTWFSMLRFRMQSIWYLLYNTIDRGFVSMN